MIEQCFSKKNARIAETGLSSVCRLRNPDSSPKIIPRVVDPHNNRRRAVYSRNHNRTLTLPVLSTGVPTGLGISNPTASPDLRRKNGSLLTPAAGYFRAPAGFLSLLVAAKRDDPVDQLFPLRITECAIFEKLDHAICVHQDNSRTLALQTPGLLRSRGHQDDTMNELDFNEMIALWLIHHGQVTLC